jgi:signal transduction histidine kinase
MDLTKSLYRISSLAGKVSEPRAALEIVLDEMCEASGASSGSISLIDPDSGRLQIEVHRGMPLDCIEAPLKLGEGITGWVALHGKPTVAPDVSRDARYRKILDDVQSEMAAPIEDRGQVIGVINMNSKRLYGFDESTLQALILLTRETAALLRQLWLVDNLKAKARHLEAVITVGQGIVSRVGQREILQSITRETLPLSGCRFCSIHLLDESGTTLVPQAAAGGRSGKNHPDLPVNETSAGVSVLRQKQLEILDLLKTEGLLPLLEFSREEGLVSLLCTPILFEDRVFGILSAYTGKPHRFSNDERNLFLAMAGLGAVAIHNARLYERVFQSEETLRQQEKLTALGLLAAEIAHEVRNPLTVLKLLFSSLNLTFPPDDPRHQDVEIIGDKLDQLEATVGRVLTFARPSEVYGLYTLDEIVAETLQLLRLKIEQAGIEVSFLPRPGLSAVRGDKGQLQQVLLNLLLNSLQAVESGGRIELRAGAESRDGNAGVFLEIEDTGVGIPEELRSDIFRSLLTGHPEGTGLGLGIVKRIAETHRGQIEVVRSQPGGTVMKLWLPVED